MDLSVVIAGAAGEGVQTVGELFARAALREGHAVFAYQEYESRIRGGRSSFRIRLTSSNLNAPRLDADLLLALNPDVETAYGPLLRPEGLLLADGERVSEPDPRRATLPFRRTAEEMGDRRMANTIAAGALGSLLGMDLASLERTVSDLFRGKSGEVQERNVAAARRGFALAQESGLVGPRAATVPKGKRTDAFLLSGNDALALGAAAAGCRFISAYPMSPSTGIITALAKDEGLGVFAEQAEDEIAAVNMALGASAAGARAMTATSGGGFALMVEALSLAGMIETPIVIVLAQRPGPATGLPTRTEQGDLLFALHAGHGEFPRLLFAPSDPRDAFEKIVRAFNLADRYQVPAIVLSDQLLADSLFSFPEFPIDRVRPEAALARPAESRPYRRYLLTPDGVSPRLYLGQGEDLVVIDSDEHDEAGHLTEDLALMRPRMVDKRLRKTGALREEIAPPEAYRTEDAETILVGWGSTRGAIREAVGRGRARARRVGMLHFTEIWPLPDLEFPKGARLICVEGNATGQFAHLLSSELGISFAASVRRYDGLPITAEEIERTLDGR